MEASLLAWAATEAESAEFSSFFPVGVVPMREPKAKKSMCLLLIVRVKMKQAPNMFEMTLISLRGRSCVFPNSSVEGSEYLEDGRCLQLPRGEMGKQEITGFFYLQGKVKGILSTKIVPPKPFGVQFCKIWRNNMQLPSDIFWMSDVSPFLNNWETEPFVRKDNTELQSSSRGQPQDKMRVPGTKGPSKGQWEVSTANQAGCF